MDTIRMTDVINLLGIPNPPYGQSSYYVQCPCCDDNPYKKHLNINIRKEVFRCPKCGVSGGIFDLYALFAEIPRDKVYKAISEKISPKTFVHKKITIQPKVESDKEYPLIDVETRHATYSAFLSKLSLASDHKTNLLNRGLNDEEIKNLGYKSAPIIGMSALSRQLRNEGFYLSGVPGFFKTESGEWTFASDKRGILIPVRDIEGRIQGLQIRCDKVDRRKFRWISSAEKKDGCRAEGWTHFVGKISESIILTEGPMKADIINALTGKTVLAVPGVNSLSCLKTTLKELKFKGLQHIQTAFDMDFLTNFHVQNGFNNLLNVLDDLGFTFGTYLWDSRYKGLDDYIWESLMNQKR